jgi:hypothetical protein
VHEGWDDEELLAALREAIQARQAVPSVKPIPASPFRLRFRTGDGIDVLTGWITL